MTVFVRQARQDDAPMFSAWFSKMDSFTPTIFQFPESYTLCAFVKGKILGYMVVTFGYGTQVLCRVVVNPEASEIEQAFASRELMKHVITLGYLNQLPEIYFTGDHPGTNRIAEHIFTEVPYPEYRHVFDKTKYPVYRLKLGELE